jgi:hypothetical protein
MMRMMMMMMMMMRRRRRRRREEEECVPGVNQLLELYKVEAAFVPLLRTYEDVQHDWSHCSQFVTKARFEGSGDHLIRGPCDIDNDTRAVPVVELA